MVVLRNIFGRFLPISSNTGEVMFNSVISVFREMGIGLKNGRKQRYDNANSMSDIQSCTDTIQRDGPTARLGLLCST